MRFESRIWKLDLDDLWWNENRIIARDSLIKHIDSRGGPAHLTGRKGAGKSTLAALIAKETGAPVIRMQGNDREDMKHDFASEPTVIIDEAQKVSEEDRQQIMHLNKHVLMVSVQDLTDDGYDLVQRIKSLDRVEIEDYVEYHGAGALFTDDAIDELLLASRGQLRLLNLLCRTALEDIELVDKMAIRHVATKRFKLRYGWK